MPMKRNIKILCLILFAMTFSSRAQTNIFSEDLKENVKSRVENGLITGIVIGVITPERTNYYSYGVKSLDTKEPVDENTIFEIGSNTKTFTGILLANEVINGKLSLDDPVQNLLPECIIAPTRNGNSIKLVHLANHSSSLPRVPNNFVRVNPRNPYSLYTISQMYEDLNTYVLTRDIGSKFEYSNYGMGLLGTVLAEKNHTTYEDLAVKIIADPLDMKNTRMTLSSDMEKRLAKGHSMGVEVDNWDFQAIAGAGAFRSTAVDMLKYLAANMGIKKSKLYPAMKLSHKYSGSGDGTIKAGLGWLIMTVEGEEIIWHDGGTGGYMSFMGFNKNGTKGVVVLTNSTGFPDDIGFHLLSPKSPLANPKPSIGTKLNIVVEKDGLEAALKTYAQLKKNHADEYNFAEAELNMLGYIYIALGKKQEAIAILKINMQQYSDSWNANDSYADALREDGQNEEAIKYYKRSLELNSDNSNAINMLKKLAPSGN